MGHDTEATVDRFIWRNDRYSLKVWFEGNEWAIQHISPNPLLGPQVVSEARHRQAKQAVWDIMSRVSKVTRDDEEGVRVATSVARWMRAKSSDNSAPRHAD